MADSGIHDQDKNVEESDEHTVTHPPYLPFSACVSSCNYMPPVFCDCHRNGREEERESRGTRELSRCVNGCNHDNQRPAGRRRKWEKFSHQVEKITHSSTSNMESVWSCGPSRVRLWLNWMNSKTNWYEPPRPALWVCVCAYTHMRRARYAVLHICFVTQSPSGWVL